MLKLVFAAFSILLATLPATAQFKNENLLLAMPDAYHQAFQDRQGNTQIIEIIPDGETVASWTQMLTISIFFGGINAPIEKYQELMMAGWAKSCNDAHSERLQTGTENGYDFSFWMSQCALNKATQKPEWVLFKAMKGNDSFYVVQKASRHPIGADAVIYWSKFLSKVKLCDTRIADRACPKP